MSRDPEQWPLPLDWGRWRDPPHSPFARYSASTLEEAWGTELSISTLLLECRRLNAELGQAWTVIYKTERERDRMELSREVAQRERKELAAKLYEAQSRCYALEANIDWARTCAWCRRRLDSSFGSPWYVEHGLRYCSAHCFTHGCRSIFAHYIDVRKETKAWQDGKEQLREIRRYLAQPRRRRPRPKAAQPIKQILRAAHTAVKK